ncbi:MAG: (d)CMP kinase [Chloroflexota bacterium]
MSEGRVRIQKALADAGVASRRKAEEMVAAGRVKVNGAVATIGQSVDPQTDMLVVDGRQIGERRQQRLYLVMAKPAGTTSTVSDRHASQTVLDLVPTEMRRGASRLYPVGRLDRESEGLLLLTNDGSWAQRMLHPSHGIEREYVVGVERRLDSEQRRDLENGIRFDEGIARLAHLAEATNADMRRLETLLGRESADLIWYRATLRQGMKRQLRRMFGAVGSPVLRLVRVRFGTVRLTNMSIGDVRPLTAAERKQLDSLTSRKQGLVVSVDGPGGSGKSTVGAGAAEQVGYRFCDTGVLYRGLTWLALERSVNPDDATELATLIGEMELAPDEAGRYVRLKVDGREVTEQLHTAEVDREVSRVSRHPQVRALLLPIQHALAAAGGIVMAGRDIGTVVLPDADLKIYLEVSIDERARRRAEARGLADDAAAVAQIADELRQRDGIDSTREAAPLRVPPDAMMINTEGNTLDQTIAKVVAAIRRSERDLGMSGA